MPKNFQTSQYDEPICFDGYLDVDYETPEGRQTFRVGIERAHMDIGILDGGILGIAVTEQVFAAHLEHRGIAGRLAQPVSKLTQVADVLRQTPIVELVERLLPEDPIRAALPGGQLLNLAQ